MSLSDDPLQTKDENLLAAAVVLRFYEEVDVSYMGEDTESALRGIQVFVDAQATSPVSATDVGHAAYWVALRQEILTAFSKQRPFRLALNPCEPYRTFGPADDYIWANRLVIHCADVLEYCFGSEGHVAMGHSPVSPSPVVSEEIVSARHPLSRTNNMIAAEDMTYTNRVTRYEELIAFDKLWDELRPSSFTPIYQQEPDRSRGQVFPELWYLSDCHVTGIQHLEIARILLAAQNPKIPRLGLGRRVAMQELDQNLKSIVKKLCGIALSNQHSPPSLITANVAIAMCGDRFTDQTEQKALLEILAKVEYEHGWPTAATQSKLIEAWGWNDNES